MAITVSFVWLTVLEAGCFGCICACEKGFLNTVSTQTHPQNRLPALCADVIPVIQGVESMK